jgi:hypothetical protein
MIQKEYRMIEQFKFDIRLIFAILNGKVSAAINRKLSRNFRQNGVEITPEQWTVLLFLLGERWGDPAGAVQRHLQGQAQYDAPHRQHGAPPSGGAHQ